MRWGIAGNIVAAWLLTLPAAAAIGAGRLYGRSTAMIFGRRERRRPGARHRRRPAMLTSSSNRARRAARRHRRATCRGSRWPVARGVRLLSACATLMTQSVRNVAIILLLALLVAFAPPAATSPTRS